MKTEISVLVRTDYRPDIAQGNNLTVASDCACFDPSRDHRAHQVMERADEKMYQRKKQMKGPGR